VYDNVKINVIAETYFTDVTLFQAQNIRNRRRHRPDLLFHPGRRCSVEQLCHREAKLSTCIEDDDGWRTERSPIVRSGIPGPQSDNANPDVIASLK
jgi:hypothetical protein